MSDKTILLLFPRFACDIGFDAVDTISRRAQCAWWLWFWVEHCRFVVRVEWYE